MSHGTTMADDNDDDDDENDDEWHFHAVLRTSE